MIFQFSDRTRGRRWGGAPSWYDGAWTEGREIRRKSRVGYKELGSEQAGKKIKASDWSNDKRCSVQKERTHLGVAERSWLVRKAACARPTSGGE